MGAGRIAAGHEARAAPTGGACKCRARPQVCAVFIANGTPVPATTLPAMNPVADLLGRLGRTVLRLALGLAAAVFLLSLLLASLLAVLGVSLWALVTGRRPTPAVLFASLRERARHRAQGPWQRAAAARRADAVDVVDVQAREVPESARSRQP